MVQNASEEILDIVKRLEGVRRGREQAIRYWEQELDQIRSQVEGREWYKMVRNYEHDMFILKEPASYIGLAMGVGGDAALVYNLITKGSIGLPLPFNFTTVVGNLAILMLLNSYRKSRKIRNTFISKFGEEAFDWARKIYKSLRRF
jgi:hypothetical protein